MPNKEFQANKEEAEILLSLGILRVASDTKQRLCPTCGNEFLDAHFVNDTKAFTQCEQREDAGRDYFNPQELKQWDFDTPRFLSLFQQGMGIANPTVNENITNLLWNFNSQEINGSNYHLFFASNINALDSAKLTIVTSLPQCAVFYTGTPQIALPDKVLLIPVAEMIANITTSGIELKETLIKQFFPSRVHLMSANGIELDNNIVVQDDTILYSPVRGGVFKQRSRIRPLATRIIEHLYQIRNYQDNYRTLTQLADDLGSSKVSISNELDRVNKLCKARGIEPILYNFGRGRWSINPTLGCCR